MPEFDVFSPSRRPGPGEALPERQDPYPAAYPDFGSQGGGAAPAGPHPGVQPPSGYEAGSSYGNVRSHDNGGTYQDSSIYQDNGHTYQEANGYPGAPGYGGDGNTGGRGESYGDAAHGDGTGVADDGSGDQGLPRRVRQASLAPQLRGAAAAAGSPPAAPATAASLTDMRNTLSAMQRGWQQGRSQTQRDTEGDADGD
jgi:hypothetical protein